MNTANIPQDKKGAHIHLTACKLQLMELAALIINGKAESLDDINKAIWTDIETIDLLLGDES